ncbi:MAG TPA: hypothetical protein VJN95_12775 [Gemmatimonadales bacterium]|nr:hypothetical protein [Gemmatimonadales bacterium]
MPAQSIVFDPEGGPISVEIRCGHAQDGSYILTLWGHNKVLQRFEGNFLDPHDDTHQFSGKASSHAGQLVQCRVEVAITPPITLYAVIVTFWQDGMNCGSLTASGDAGTLNTVGINLFARLEPLE